VRGSNCVDVPMNVDILIMDHSVLSFSSKEEEIQYWKDLAMQLQSGFAINLLHMFSSLCYMSKKPKMYL
jgi:hypothetical protein